MEKSNYNRGGGGAGRGGGSGGGGRGGSGGGGRGGSGGGGRGGSGGGRGGNNYQQYHQGQYQTGGGAGSSGGGGGAGTSYQQHNQGQIQSGGYGGRGGRGGGRGGTQMWTNPPPAQPSGDWPVQGGQGGTQPLEYRPVQGGQGGTQRPVSSMGQGAGATGGRGAWSGGPPHVAGRGSRAPAVGGGAGAGQAHRTGSVPVPDSVTSDMKSLQISDSPPGSLATSSENRLVPMKRPDRGGVVAVRSTRLLVNHFPVAFNSQSTILHYNVDVKQEVTLGGRYTKKTIPKSVLNLIREKLFSDSIWECHLQKTAYDSEKNIFSAVKLPTGSFKVELSDGEDTKIRVYTVTIDLVKELQLSKLKDYLAGNLMSMPREILQGMDLVMKENPSRHRITVGRSTYSREFRREDDLGCGLAAFKGFQQSLKPTSQGLALCLDYSVLAFRKRMPVIDFLKEHLWGYGFKGVNDIARLKREVLDALKGLKINVTHRVTKQKYTIAGLTDQNTRNLFFTLEDLEGKDPPREVTLVNYFREKHGKDIMYKDIPCLDVGKNRKNYVPLEFCILVEGQRYPKDDLDNNAARLLKNISVAPPAERMNTILKMVRAEDAPCGGDIIKNFEIGVDKNMTSVVGRVIGPPDLKLATPAGNTEVVKVDERCQWNLTKKSVVEGRPVERWALIDFTSSERYERLNPENFVRNLRRRCERLGIHMEEPLAFQATGMHVFDDVNRLRQLLQHIIEVASRKTKVRLQIVVCVMARKHSGYKSLKFVSETQIGVVTQCCLSKLANEGKDQNLANLALKINAKLGGSNVELIERLPRFEGNDPVMFVGADVNHPGALNATCPSIAAVVASMNWPAATKYAARVCPQNHRKEKIVNFGAMCLELVNTFARLNKVKPKKIVVFRDGVSESQFDMVLNEELRDLKMAIYDENYRPTITLVVAQKRHNTRLFLENQGGDVRRNISPGTVVDTKIVHPFEYDFYLCSHYGNLGTSKPTHYYVLHDEHNFTSDQLQKLIYQLCFTFARCTKPVSLVPPVYYADLVAFRGRMFQEVLMEMQFPPSASSSTSHTSSSSSSAPSFDDAFYKLHSELQNIMFFI